MAPTTLRPPFRQSSSPPIAATSNDGVLPLDLIHDILLRLPTESICRSRAVCRSWRSLLCHPDFIAAASNPGLLFAAAVCECFDSYRSSRLGRWKILDIESGDNVKEVRLIASDDWRSFYCSMDSMSHERLVCAILMDKQISLLDPATGALSVLPDHTPLKDASNFCAMGRSASTGEHKVLALTTSHMMMSSDVCKILTLGCGDDGWRETGSPPLKVVTSCIGFPVLNGVAYILGDAESTGNQLMIMEFDLDCETWRSASLRAPLDLSCLSLAELQGHLVAAYDDRYSPIELWFLVDPERSIWSKRYTITMPHHHDSLYCDEYFQKPLALLDDGRIVTWMRVVSQTWYYVNYVNDEFLRIYDPRTETFTDGTLVHNCNHVTVFTWSLLPTGKRGALDRVARLALISRRQH